MKIFQCEDSVDGIFTGVYDAWASRLGHGNVKLQLRRQTDLELFAEYCEVQADGEKAGKVARSIRRKMGEDAYQTIYQAALSFSQEKADCIYRVAVKGMSMQVTDQEARKVIWNLQDPNVSRVFELSRRTWHEAHRYMGFVRFQELKNGILFSEIQSENYVLPLIGGHFADRFPKENFMIYDNTSNDCLVYRCGSGWFILKDRKPEGEGLIALSEREAYFQDLWRGFCTSISIEARENPDLQQQMWPLRFRRWMTEGKQGAV